MTARWRMLLEVVYNSLGTHVPSHRLRQYWLRLLGARIGNETSIFRGTTVLSPACLTVGDRCAVGWRCVLDARGGLTLEHDVVIASDVRILTADHDVDADNFAAVLASVMLRHHVWIATGATILKGVEVKAGAVVAAGSVVTRDVPERMVVAGVPALSIRRRTSQCDYAISFRPRFH